MRIRHPSVGGQWARTLVARVDIGMVFYQAMKPQCGKVIGSVSGCQSGYMSLDI